MLHQRLDGKGLELTGMELTQAAAQATKGSTNAVNDNNVLHNIYPFFHLEKYITYFPLLPLCGIHGEK